MPEKRILLVEDEPATRDIIAHVLWTEGYRLDVATTVAEATNFLGSGTYALVIADWRLPDGDGLLIVDLGIELGAKTIFMSGYLFQIPGGRADRHEMLMKPIRPSELIDAVERAIGKADATSGSPR
jgi:DNA-binding response OmpR family regulator